MHDKRGKGREGRGREQGENEEGGKLLGYSIPVRSGGPEHPEAMGSQTKASLLLPWAIYSVDREVDNSPGLLSSSTNRAGHILLEIEPRNYDHKQHCKCPGGVDHHATLVYFLSEARILL